MHQSSITSPSPIFAHCMPCLPADLQVYQSAARGKFAKLDARPVITSGMVRGKWLLFAGIVILAGIGAGALSRLRRPRPFAATYQGIRRPQPPGPEIGCMARFRPARVVPVAAPDDGTIEGTPGRRRPGRFRGTASGSNQDTRC